MSFEPFKSIRAYIKAEAAIKEKEKRSIFSAEYWLSGSQDSISVDLSLSPASSKRNSIASTESSRYSSKDSGFFYPLEEKFFSSPFHPFSSKWRNLPVLFSGFEEVSLGKEYTTFKGQAVIDQETLHNQVFSKLQEKQVTFFFFIIPLNSLLPPFFISDHP